MRFVLFGFGAIVLLAVTACGGGKKAPTSATDERCTNGATATAALSSELTPRASRTDSPFRIVDDELYCRISLALLTAAELGGSWGPSKIQHHAVDLVPSQTGLELCGVAPSAIQKGIRIFFERSAADDSTPGKPASAAAALDEAIGVLDEDSARSYLAALRDKCAGSKTTTVHAAEIGDESLILEAHPDTHISITYVLVRRGAVLMAVSESVPTPMTADGLLQIAQKADAKLAASLPRLMAVSTVPAE